MAGRIDPWEQQPGESAQAFQAFRTYRDLGVERSLAKVAQKLGKSKTLMDRWSGRWGWVKRAAAWDREDDRKFLAEQRYARKSIARRQAKFATSFQQKLIEALNSMDASKMSASDMIRWLEVTTRIETAAASIDLESSVYLAIEAEKARTGKSFATLTDEERADRIAALVREAQNRLRIADEEQEASEEARAEVNEQYRSETFLDNVEVARSRGGSYALDHRGETP